MDYREYLDKIVDAATSFAESVSDVTKQKADEAKAAVKTKRLEIDLDKAYRSLGHIMYQIEKGVLSRDDQIVEAACRQIELIEEEIKNLAKTAAKPQKEDCCEEESCCEKEAGCCCEKKEEAAEGSAEKKEIEIEIIRPDSSGESVE